MATKPVTVSVGVDGK